MMICCDCGTVGTPKRHMEGSVIVEVFLWCLFLLPGLLYSFWRLSTKCKVCRSCGSRTMIPLESPRGQMLAQQFDAAKR